MNSFKSPITFASIFILMLSFSLKHLRCPFLPHWMHLYSFIFLLFGSSQFLRHLSESCPTWLHFSHRTTFFSVQSRAWWPILLHLKHIFSLQSKLSWVSFPHRIQFFFFVSLGQPFEMWPNCWQLWHFIVGFSSAQYLMDLSLFNLSNAPSLSSRISSSEAILSSPSSLVKF